MAAILYLRRLCTQDVLVDALGDVSGSSVGGVGREIGPLLAEAGLRPPTDSSTRTPPGTGHQHCE